LADANKWPQIELATQLPAALTGKARKAFTHMPVDEAGDYSKLNMLF